MISGRTNLRLYRGNSCYRRHAPVKFFSGKTRNLKPLRPIRRNFPQNKFSTYTKICEFSFHMSVPRGTFFPSKPRPFYVSTLIHNCGHPPGAGYTHPGRNHTKRLHDLAAFITKTIVTRKSPSADGKGFSMLFTAGRQCSMQTNNIH